MSTTGFAEGARSVRHPLHSADGQEDSSGERSPRERDGMATGQTGLLLPLTSCRGQERTPQHVVL